MNLLIFRHLSPILLSLFIIACNKLPELYDILTNKNPENGFIYMGDPFILNHNSIYYLYGTTSDDGFLVYESYDLENWSDAVGSNDGLP